MVNRRVETVKPTAMAVLTDRLKYPVPLNIALSAAEGKKKARNMCTRQSDPTTGRDWSRVIALDGGTTNTRARLIRDGKVVATARRTAGVRDTVLGERSSGQTLADAVRDVIAEVAGPEGGPPRATTALPRADLILAAGMISSEVGLLAVPHVPAPAGIAELAAAVMTRTFPQISPWPIHFVPGIRTPADAGPDGWMNADVMRGEECETLGALSELTRKGGLRPGQEALAFVWPGSHTKLVEVDGQGRITRSHTTLAGELIQSVAGHTLIAASLPAELPSVLDMESAEAGARATRQQGLERAAFLVRVGALLGTISPEQLASFWVGAVAADDTGHLAVHPILRKGGRCGSADGNHCAPSIRGG